MRKSLLWLLLAVVPLLGGCWDAIEIENLKFIMVMGIDREPSGRVLVSLHAVNVEQLNVSTESSSSSGGELPYYLTTVRGRSLYEAFHNYFTRKHGRRGHFGHLQAIILGEEFAKDSLPECIDWLNRERELSVETEIFLARGRAYDLMKVKPIQERVSGSFIEGLETETANIGFVPTATVPILLTAFTTPGREAIIPLLEKGKLDLLGQGEKNETLQLGGAGVFRGSKFCGWLTPNETRGYLWITGKPRDPLVIVGMDERKVAFDVQEIKRKIKPHITGNKVRISVEMEARGEVAEIFGRGPHVDEAFFKEVGKRAADEIKQEIKNTIALAQRLGSDFIGFGEIVRGSTNNKKWKELDWRTQFPQVPVEVKVKGLVRRSGVAVEQLKAW